jgi:c-di-GMP-binding flagellar brake protein YcgR
VAYLLRCGRKWARSARERLPSRNSETAMFERTATLFRRLTRTKAAETALTSNPEEERRIWVRFPCDVETRCEPANGPAAVAAEEERLSARIRDVSLGGIALVANRSYQPGTLLSVELPVAEGEPATTVLACVVHVQSQEAGEWLLGCSFSRELTDEDMQAFGAARARPSRPDNRNWERFPAAVKALYAPATEAEPAWLPAQVANLSASGIALLVDRAIKNGTLLTTQLQAANGQTVISLLACVVHVTPRAESQWLLGCNFISELSEADLAALLKDIS